MDKHLKIYTDGACSQGGLKGDRVGQVGGWAALIDGKHLIQGFQLHTDSLDMEILAAINALKALDNLYLFDIFEYDAIQIVTDCKAFADMYRKSVEEKSKDPHTYNSPTFLDFLYRAQHSSIPVKIRWERRERTKKNSIVDYVAKFNKDLIKMLTNENIELETYLTCPRFLM